VGAGNWLNAAWAVAEAIGAEQAPKIGFPGSMKLKIELLQQLAESDAPDSMKTVFRLDASGDELSKGLAAEITAGRFPRAQVQLVCLIVEKLKIGVQWPPIISACAERLRVADVGAKETESLVACCWRRAPSANSIMGSTP
jgi:hypothetical protein